MWKQLLCINPLSLDPKLTLSSSEDLDLRRTVSYANSDSHSTFYIQVVGYSIQFKSHMKMKSTIYYWKMVTDFWRHGVRLHTFQTETKSFFLTNSEDCCGLGMPSLIVILIVLEIHFEARAVSTMMKTYCNPFKSCKHSDENLLHWSHCKHSDENVLYPFQEL